MPTTQTNWQPAIFDSANATLADLLHIADVLREHGGNCPDTRVERGWAEYGTGIGLRMGTYGEVFKHQVRTYRASPDWAAHIFFTDPEEFLRHVTSEAYRPANAAPLSAGEATERMLGRLRADGGAPAPSQSIIHESVTRAKATLATKIVQWVRDGTLGYDGPLMLAAIQTGLLSSGVLGITYEEAVKIEAAVTAVNAAFARATTLPATAAGHAELWNAIEDMPGR